MGAVSPGNRKQPVGLESGFQDQNLDLPHHCPNMLSVTEEQSGQGSQPWGSNMENH